MSNSSGFVVLHGFRYEIDGGKSNIGARLASTGELRWTLGVEAVKVPSDQNLTSEYCNEDPECAASMSVSFAIDRRLDWRELDGFLVDLDYSEFAGGRIFRDDLGELYLGCHVFPVWHRISFPSRVGDRLHVNWVFEGSEDPEVYSSPVEVQGLLRFATLRLNFPEVPEALRREYGELTPQEFQNAANAWEPDSERARQLIAEHFDPNDFGEPTKWMWSLTYPMIASE